MTSSGGFSRPPLPASPLKGRGKNKEFQIIHLSAAFTNTSDRGEAMDQLFQNISSASCVEDQMEVIKKISAEIVMLDKEICEDKNRLRLAVELYLSAPLKHPAKSALSKTFNLMTGCAKEDFVISLKESLKIYIVTVMRNQDPVALREVASALIGCHESLSVGPEIFDSLGLDLLQFLNDAMGLCCSFLCSPNAPVLKVEVNKITHSISRIIIYALQRPEINSLKNLENVRAVLDSIFKTSVVLMNSPEVPLDTRTNLGFVVVLEVECLEGITGLMQLIEVYKSEITRDELSLLCICSGLLSGLKSDEFMIVHQTRRKTVMACILDTALLVNERSIQESNMVLALWRVIQQWTRILTLNPKLVICLEMAPVENLINHLWGLLDHYMDNVRHLARGILENVMQLRNNFLSIGIDLRDKMAEAVLLTPEIKRSRYVILSTMTAYLNTDEIMKKIPNVIDNLLTAMQYPSMSSHVSGAFVAMSTADFGRLPYSDWYSTWVKPLFDVMQKSNTSEATALEETLSKIIKLCPAVINEVLPDVNKKKNLGLPKLRSLLTCMKIARKLGVLPTKNDEEESLWLGALPVEVFQSTLWHECDEVRVSALALIVETNRSTEVVSQTDFGLLKLFLEYNVNCEVPSFRQQILGFLCKLLTRLKDSGRTLSRPTRQKVIEENRGEKVLHNYKQFIVWLLLFCFENLRVGSNYSRRICSLKILTLIFDILKHDPLLANSDCEDKMWTRENGLTLLSVIFVDTYEENMSMAMNILASFPADILGLNVYKNLFKLFQKGCGLASSIHPSDCISAAYLLELCCRIYLKSPQNFKDNLAKNEQALDVLGAVNLLKAQFEREAYAAQLDILHAASAGPMHGTLFCIRHILELVPNFGKLEQKPAWKELMKSLVDLCFKVDSIVSPVVNSSSPEGHLPMDFNQGCDLIDSNTPVSSPPSKVTAQMVLLCSWRTVKEVSLLLGKLSDCCPILPDINGLLSENQILAIGTHLTTLLEETKHRGAFEQAYVGFSLLASRLWRHKKKSLQELPKKWLDELMIAIQSNETSLSKLCATRRSAGVPFMVQALVSAEPQNGAGLLSLQSTMSQLLTCAADDCRAVECRTHALNILRALYRHAPLAQHIAPYVAEGVTVAISGFRRKSWAERNSATLLFSSLMTRIFGVRRSREELSSRNKMTGRVFFHRYPELYEFLLAELTQAVGALTSGDVAELAILHPILLLIARLYPSSFEGTDTLMQLNTFVPLVRECASNSVLKTRVLAAKAIVPLITVNVFVKYVDDLIHQAAYSYQENLVHGLALQVVHLLSNTSTLNDEQSSVLVDHLDKWVTKLLKRLSPSSSNLVQEMVLQVIEVVIYSWHSLVSQSVWLSVKQKIVNMLLPEDSCGSECQLLGLGVLEVRATRVLLQLLILAKESDSVDIIFKLLKHTHYEVVQETLVGLEKIMRTDSQDLSVEAEDIIPDVVGGDGHWMERLPEGSLATLYTVLNKSTMLGPVLASLATMKSDVLGRLALRALVHVAPSVWCESVDLEQILSLCSSSHEGSSCAAFACFSSLLQHIVQSNDNIPVACEDGCKALQSFCSEDNGVMSRMVAVNFLLQHRQALDGKYTFLSDETVSELWICALKLICDDNSEVRSQAALISQVDFPVVPRKSLEILVDAFLSALKNSPSHCLATLLALALGPLPDCSSFETDEERVFEKGETNMFIEHEVLTDLLQKDIFKLVSEGIQLTVSEWNWIWRTISGTDSINITKAESFFDAVRHFYDAEFTQDGFLLPLPIVCSLRRLHKIELLFHNVIKAQQHEFYPFNFDKLMV